MAFSSRLGDDLTLWAIFERPGDPAVSPHLTEVTTRHLTPEDPDLLAAFTHQGLEWAN